jgi:hypothetical protein
LEEISQNRGKAGGGLGIPVLRTSCEPLSSKAAPPFSPKKQVSSDFHVREKHAQCVKKSVHFTQFAHDRNLQKKYFPAKFLNCKCC